MSTYTHKRGAAFSHLLTIPAEFADGHFVGWTVDSDVRTAQGTKVADLVCEWVDPAATRYLRITCLDTTAWPLSTLYTDVRFIRTSDGFPLITTTAIFPVVAAITQTD